MIFVKVLPEGENEPGPGFNGGDSDADRAQSLSRRLRASLSRSLTVSDPVYTPGGDYIVTITCLPRELLATLMLVRTYMAAAARGTH